MIEVADIDSFFEMASAASEAASSENEDMFEGGEVPAPAEYQAHLVHWNQHFLFIQSREFTDTDGIPEDVKKRILEHLQTHEYFMYKAARVNLELATILSRNKYFPCVFKLAPTDLPLSQVVIMLSNPPAPMPPPNQPPIPDGSGQEMEAQILNELGDTPLPDEMGIPDNMEEGEPNIAMEGESINVG